MTLIKDKISAKFYFFPLGISDMFNAQPFAIYTFLLTISLLGWKKEQSTHHRHKGAVSQRNLKFLNLSQTYHTS